MVGLLAIVLILAGNSYVFSAYRTSPSIINQTKNSWSNFPFGLLSAVFVPDTPVLAGKVAWSDWFLTSTELLVLVFTILLVANTGLGRRAFSHRVFYYTGMIFAVSAFSNLVSLLRGEETVGPSTAWFASFGLYLGFSVVNVILWLRSGRRTGGIAQAMGLAFSLAPVLVAIPLALLNPIAFFNIGTYQGYSVDWISHIICLAMGSLVVAPYVLEFERTARERAPQAF